jgi:hypothetical protein
VSDATTTQDDIEVSARAILACFRAV